MMSDKCTRDPGLLPNKLYQRIELPDGRILPGNDRSYLNETIFDADVSGQTMLDIGSCLGHFCIEGLRRGMRAATGIEPYSDSISLARELGQSFDLTPQYIQGDFETWHTDERYDVVLCLNVLHHMYDPVHAMRRMMRMARRKVVLEVAVPTVGEMASSHFNRLLPLVGRNVPMLVCGRRGSNAHAATRTFLLSRQAIETIFNYHSHLYEPVKTYQSPMKKRMIVEARRRRISHLTVICGPSGCGKSTFMRRLNEDADLRRQLDLPEDVSAAVAAGRINSSLPGGEQEHVILHYDMLRPFDRSLRTYERDPACDLLQIADKISFLTIVTDSARLRDQLANHKVSRRKGLWAVIAKPNVKLNKRHHKLLALYEEPSFLQDRYREWFEFCAKVAEKTDSHTFVENQGTYAFHGFDKWEELSGRLF